MKEGEFNAAAALRQNLEWEARQRQVKEWKRAKHNAFVDYQNCKTLDEQRKWYAVNHQYVNGPDFRLLDPRFALELILKAEAEHEQVEGKEESEGQKCRTHGRAKAFLVKHLSNKRRVRAEVLKTKAESLGISIRSLHRAKKLLGVRSQRIDFGSRGHFVWFLPDQDRLAK